MSRSYIPTLGEHIIEFSTIAGDPASLPEVPPYVDWIGPAPRLATPDEATSYLHIDRLQTAYAIPMAAVELSRFPDLSDALIHAQMRVESSAPSASFDAYVFDAAGNNATAWIEGVTTGEWTTFTGQLELISGELVSSVGPVWATVVGPFFDSDADRWDVSWIAVSEEGEFPLRQRQRRDGLGMGAPAIRVGGSRQGSTRIRGHY